MRVGLGFDVHAFGGDRRLVLGGVTIDGPGLTGHSDADVVAHAVADALLGAAGMPDLGTLFPAADERYLHGWPERAGRWPTWTSSWPPSDLGSALTCAGWPTT